MKTMLTTEIIDGNIILPSNISIKSGSKVLVNVFEDETEYSNTLNRILIEEIENSFEEIDRIYNKNNLQLSI